MVKKDQSEEILAANKQNSSDTTWLDKEITNSYFKDKRLKKRFRSLLEQIWKGFGETLPFACQDWANTKAAYRFFSNDHVTKKQILNGHFQSTKERFAKIKDPILVLQDTTEFSYRRVNPDKVGAITVLPSKDIFGKEIKHTLCGILMHSSLAITTTGIPLGLTAIKFWTRKKFIGCNALKKQINPTRAPIEEKESYRWLDNLKRSTRLLKAPDRCIHIGDRESDIYELFCLAQKLGTHFLVRTCVDRLSGGDKPTIEGEMRDTKIKGLHRIEVRDKNGNASQAILEIKYRRIHVLPPIGKQKKYPNLCLNVVHAQEKDPPKNRERIVWKLMTDLPVTTRQEAIEKLNWYAMRWKIETFHKILKSGCKAEASKLITADRLVNLISIFCILSWRIFWMTMINRSCSGGPAKIGFTNLELNLLDHLIKDKKIIKE